MSIRFARASEVIVRLKTVRTALTLTSANFDIWGAGEYEAALKTSDFMGAAKALLVVTVGNSSSSILHEQAGGEGVCSHAIDVTLFLRPNDIRAQETDERAVWFKEFVIRSLFGCELWADAPLLFFTGDQFNALQNTAVYSRTFRFQQSVYIQREDVFGDGDFDDLNEFLQMLADFETDAPPLGDISETSLDITIRNNETPTRKKPHRLPPGRLQTLHSIPEIIASAPASGRQSSGWPCGVWRHG